MKKLAILLLASALVFLPPVPTGKESDKERDRVANAGKVLKEILDIPEAALPPENALSHQKNRCRYPAAVFLGGQGSSSCSLRYTKALIS